MIRTDLDNSGPNRTISECSGPKWTICATFGDARATTGNEKRRRTTKDEKERQKWARGERWAGFVAGFAGYCKRGAVGRVCCWFCWVLEHKGMRPHGSRFERQLLCRECDMWGRFFGDCATNAPHKK